MHILRIVTLCLSLLLAEALSAQSLKFGVDGEMWRAFGMSETGRLAKLSFIRGVYDGVLFGGAVDSDKYLRTGSWVTLIESVDTFYVEPANRPIPVALALQIIQLRSAGASEPTIDLAVRKLRCKMSLVDSSMTPTERASRVKACDSMK